jgi:hypothetical protein
MNLDPFIFDDAAQITVVRIANVSSEWVCFLKHPTNGDLANPSRLSFARWVRFLNPQKLDLYLLGCRPAAQIGDTQVRPIVDRTLPSGAVRFTGVFIPLSFFEREYELWRVDTATQPSPEQRHQCSTDRADSDRELNTPIPPKLLCGRHRDPATV